MRRSVSLLLAGLLLASAPLALAGDDDEDDDRKRHRARAPAPIGAFVVEDASRDVKGDHVSFTYSDAGIHHFRAHDRDLFSLRVLDERGERGERDERPRPPRAHTEGSLFRVRTDNFTFTAHDNPSAVAKVETRGRSFLAFNEGVLLFSRDEDRIRFSAGDLKGGIRGDDLRVLGRNVTAAGGLLVFLETPRGSFDKHRTDIGHAIGRGHVGAEATFNDVGGAVEHEVVSYGNVTVQTVKAERGNLTLLIDGHGVEGRVLVFNVDGRVLGADREEKLSILLDNVSVARASNLTDALDPTDDGYSPEAYLVYDPQAEAFQLMLTVPHYSVHTLSVTTLIEIAKPAVVVGVLVGTALLVPAALVLFRRK